MCFYQWTTLFFSTWPKDYEQYLQEELWGCFKYIGIPFESLKNMPIQERKYYISRHNYEAEKYENGNVNKEASNVSGEGINSFARTTMSDLKRKNGI